MEYEYTPNDCDKEEEIKGVLIVRKVLHPSLSSQPFVSYITLDQSYAFKLARKVYGSYNAGGTYSPTNKSQWQNFVFEFFPGWKIYSLIV